ncbi:MAG TPA: hypothetical protein VKJ01_07340, partial [Candidatus Solibacter sp.]|nr:hypothetical protein [Candidatus Solibacter sp.]
MFHRRARAARGRTASGRTLRRKGRRTCATAAAAAAPAPQALVYCHFVYWGIVLVVIAGVSTIACGREAGSFPPPAQLSLDLGPDPGGPRSLVRMNDPDADA